MFAHSSMTTSGANDMNGKMLILRCMLLQRGSVDICWTHRVHVCEIHHTAAGLAQRSATLPLLQQNPSYAFLSPLLRAAHVGLFVLQLLPIIHTSNHRDR